MHLLYAPGQLYTPPAYLMEGLRRVRPCVDLLWDPGKHVWLLGEVRWNSERQAGAERAIAAHWSRVKQVGVKAINPHSLWEHDLARQGWSWIRDYRPDRLNWHIVTEYARMCHKEDFGLLDAEYFHQVDESDQAPFERKLAAAREEGRYRAKDAFYYAMRGRRSVGPSPALH